MNSRYTLLPVFALTVLLGASANTGMTLSTGIPVDAQSNIFAAGNGNTQSNGGGKPPPSVVVPSQARTVIFRKVTGRVSCCGNGNTFNGPDGGINGGGSTDIQSSGGIAGVIHKHRTMFLVGVFVGGTSSLPPRLDMTNSATESSLGPKLNQTFYVGNGKAPHGLRTVHIPTGAKRLYLGFADSNGFHGAPGAYGDNVGFLRVDVQTR